MLVCINIIALSKFSKNKIEKSNDLSKLSKKFSLISSLS